MVACGTVAVVARGVDALTEGVVFRAPAVDVAVVVGAVVADEAVGGGTFGGRAVLG